MSEPITPDVQSASTQPNGMAPATVWDLSSQAKARRRRRRIVRIVLALLLMAAYAAGAHYFSEHFTPGTTVDGIDAGLMTEPELASALEARAASYEQHLTDENGFDATLTSADMGLSFDAAGVASAACDRESALLWLPYLIAPRHMLIDGNIQMDDELLSARISEVVGAYNAEAEQPTNAKARYDEEQGAFVIDPESVGTALDAQAVAAQSQTASRELRSEVELGHNELAEPAIARDDETLVELVDKANAILDEPLQVTLDGQDVASPDRDTRVKWMTFTDDQRLEARGITDWVNATEAITDAGNATDDEHVWELDARGTALALLDVLMDGGGSAELVRNAIVTKPPVTPGAKERGRHIDINLTTQFARFYDSDGTVIWDSYFVSGGWDVEFQEMHETPCGTFAIQGKETNRTLVGRDRNNDGKPDYESFVNYWMPFLDYDYGLHDATWRSDFGGDIRYWYGSHGCINLPYDKAEVLFGLVNVGDPVIIHE